MKKIRIVNIDSQVDFCDPKGNLYVTGAEKDCERFAAMLDKISDKIDDIDLTMDSHNWAHIAHPMFCKNSTGEHPKPFTLISVDDVKNGVWTTTKPSLYKWGLEYVRTLEKNSRYVLCIWPPHCIIGSFGQCLFPTVQDSLKRWCEKYFAYPNFVTKGSNILTEHYSAIIADVPDPNDFTTQLNTRFIQNLEESDIVLVCGQASSHCVKNTVVDIVNNFSDPAYAKKLRLIKDCMSPVPGFENLQDELWTFCKQHGIEVVDSRSPI